MSATIKWDVDTTIKFIQLYKLHPCLWNFQSMEYKMKQKREAACNSIVQAMNISGFGTLEVKNKIKNLRSTYQQEKKKIQVSGTGLNKVYTSNIKWLDEMDEVFSKDFNKITYENNRRPKTDPGSQDTQELPAYIAVNSNQQNAVPVTTTTNPAFTKTHRNTARAKKRSREIVQAISDLKKLNEDVNSQNENVFDVFGKSVALQLKNLSTKNALLAQNRIQNILTEYGIKEISYRTASHSSPS